MLKGDQYDKKFEEEANFEFFSDGVYYSDIGPAQMDDMGPGITESLGHFHCNNTGID